MPDPTAIRLASDARRADLADDLYNLSVDARDLVDKAYQDERAALLVAIDLLAKAGADPGGDLDKLRDRYTTLDAENAALEAERDDLRAKLANLTGSADLTDASDGWRHIASHQIGGVRVDLLTNGARGVSMDHREDLALMMAPSLGRLRDMDAMRAEVARLATALATAEQEVHRVAVSAAEVTRERDAFIETTNCVTAKEAGESIDRFVAEIAAVKARQAQSDSAATDACRYLDCSAANLLATVTSLYETRGGLVAEVADLRAKLSAARTVAEEARRAWRAAADDCRRAEERAKDAEVARATCNGSCDIALARRQVGPDSVVPGNARECAELWESEAHRVAVAAAEVTAERDALAARVAALEAVVKAAASTLHVYVGEDFEVCRVCGIEDAKADHVDLDAYARGRDAADPVTVPAPDRAEELIIAQYDGCRKVAAELGHDGNWYAWGEWVKVHPRARHIQVESMRRALASLATPSPRYVAVKRDEVNGRPASWFHTEAEAERYVALCNDNPDLFGADDEIEGALESYTHAVVDTRPEGP